MSNRLIRIAIVEDQLLMAEFLEICFARQPDFALVGCAANGEAGWKLCLATRPDLVLVDIELPGLDGLELAKRLLAQL